MPLSRRLIAHLPGFLCSVALDPYDEVTPEVKRVVHNSPCDPAQLPYGPEDYARCCAPQRSPV